MCARPRRREDSPYSNSIRKMGKSTGKTRYSRAAIWTGTGNQDAPAATPFEMGNLSVAIVPDGISCQGPSLSK